MIRDAAPRNRSIRSTSCAGDSTGPVFSLSFRKATEDKSCQEIVQTYYGPQKLHEVLERATWHIGQHCRQWMMLLEMGGIGFERPLSDPDFVDLPMPKQVWDG